MKNLEFNNYDIQEMSTKKEIIFAYAFILAAEILATWMKFETISLYQVIDITTTVTLKVIALTFAYFYVVRKFHKRKTTI